MELVEFAPLVKTGDAEEYRLIVKDDKNTIKKRMIVSGCALAVARAGRKSERIRFLAKVLTEADRDLAFEKHGEDWRKHCPWKMGESPDVRRIGDKIMKSHPELF